MTVPVVLTALTGNWRGTNRLWLSPEEPVRESESTAEITLAAQGKFAVIQYTWADEGQSQDGMLVLGQETQHKLVKAIWIDSWHMNDKFMLCEGAIEPNGTIWVKGSYAAPPDPDWGWQISIELQADDLFRFMMHNISPDNKKMLAVEVTYTRQP
jgi:hypothetical protein